MRKNINNYKNNIKAKNIKKLNLLIMMNLQQVKCKNKQNIKYNNQNKKFSVKKTSQQMQRLIKQKIKHKNMVSN